MTDTLSHRWPRSASRTGLPVDRVRRLNATRVRRRSRPARSWLGLP
jgi:hypothetical protein